jgi:hypothetical protein
MVNFNSLYSSLERTRLEGFNPCQTLSRAGLVTGRRDRFCVYYRISAGAETREGKLLGLLREMLAGQPAAEALRKWFRRWFDPATWQTTQIAKEVEKYLSKS